MIDRAKGAVAGLIVALILDSLAWGLTVHAHVPEMVPAVLAIPLLFLAIGLAGSERTFRGWRASATALLGVSTLAAGAVGLGMGPAAGVHTTLLPGLLFLAGSAAVLHAVGRDLGKIGRGAARTQDLFWLLVGGLAGLGVALPVKSAAGTEGEALLAAGLFSMLAPSVLSRWGAICVPLFCALSLTSAGGPPWKVVEGRFWERDGLTEVRRTSGDGCSRILRNGFLAAYGCEPPTQVQAWKTRAIQELSRSAGRMLWIGETGPMAEPGGSASTTRVGLTEARQVLGLPPGYGREPGEVNERDKRRAQELEIEDELLARRMPKFGIILVDGLGNHASRVPGNPFEEDYFLMTPYAVHMMVRGGVPEDGAVVTLTYGDKPYAAAALVEAMLEKNPLRIYRLSFEKHEGTETPSVLVSLLSVSEDGIARLATRLQEKGLLNGDLLASGPRSGPWFSGGSSGIVPRADSSASTGSETEKVEAPSSPIYMSLTEEGPLPVDSLPRLLSLNLPIVLCIVLLHGWRASRGNGATRSEQARSVMVGALGSSVFLLLAIFPGRRLLWEPAEGAQLLWEVFLAGACVGLLASTRTSPNVKRLLSALLGILILFFGARVNHDPLGDGRELVFGLLAGFFSSVQAPQECSKGTPYGLLAGIPIGILVYELAVALVGVVQVTMALILAYLLILTLWPLPRWGRARDGDSPAVRRTWLARVWSHTP